MGNQYYMGYSTSSDESDTDVKDKVSTDVENITSSKEVQAEIKK